MLEILVTAIVSFIVAFLAIPVVILIADRKKLYDVPDERKLHTHAIASLGGVGIFLGFMFSCLLTINISVNIEFQYFLASSFMIFFIGLKDDLVLLSATKKFIAQIMAAAIIIHLGGIRIESFYGIASIDMLDPMVGIPFTYVTIILIMNAFNLIDGIDGLAGSLGLLATLLLGTYFYFAGMYAYTLFSFSLSAALLAFLIFNYNPARIFMGDSGSLLIGTVASILTLKFINVASAPGAIVPVASAAAIAIAIIIVPLVDTIRVFSIRIIKGRSPFSPDRNHIHHLLLDRGFNHSTVTHICVVSNIVLIMATYLARSVGNTWLIIGLFATCFTIMGYLYFSLPKRKLAYHRQYLANLSRQQQFKSRSKVINLNTKEEIAAEKVNG